MTEVKKESLPTIDIKGKDYVLVKDRVLYFNSKYANGSIRTERYLEGEREVIKAIVIPDVSNSERYFTGYSQAIWGDGYINKTSALENAESSAVGRALAFMGIGVLETIASADEVKKANITEKIVEKAVEKQAKNPEGEKEWFNKPQLEMLKKSVDYVKKFDHSEKLINDLATKFKISKEMKMEIANVWAEIE